jgi:hypothetical protein
MKLYRILILIILYVLSNKVLLSQDSSNCAGKEFLLCFPQNEDTTNIAKDIALQIYISSFKGNICHYNISYILNEKLVSITDSVSDKIISTINIPIELEIHSFKNNEKKGIFITSDQPISVSAISKQLATSDAFLCYPTNIIDTSYIVASYKNKFYSVVGHPKNRYSAIVIAALEDSTSVDIIPTVPLEGIGNDSLQPVKIALNKGETRQLIAKISKEYDLTGSIINSNKKIVVYSTHQGAYITAKGYNQTGNTDVIIKQTLPISRLGTNAIYTTIINTRYNNRTLGRIISPFDNNILMFSDTSIILNKQKFYEFEYDTTIFVNTSKPSLFAEYCLSGINNNYLDPFLLLLPPKENYQKEYLFQVPIFNSLPINYISVIIDSIGKNTLELDNISSKDNPFNKIPGTNYIIIQFPIKQGTHYIKSDSSFGLIVYGFGEAESYGYIPGMKTDRKIDYYFDKIPPQIIIDNGCTSTVTFSDEGKYKTGIAKISILNNVNIILTKDTGYRDYFSEKYKLSLNNPYQDGKLLFEVYDLAGNFKVDSILIKGFTVSFNKFEQKTMKFQEFRCDTVTLNNFGNNIQNFRAFFLNNIIFSVPPSLTDLILTSNSNDDLIFCIYPKQLGLINDTLILIDDCDRIIRIPFEVQVEPNIYEGESGCGVKIRLITSNKYLYIINNEIITSKFTGNIQVFNIIGNLVYSKSYNNESLEENIDLNTGIYFIMITDQSGNQLFEKILITN